MKVRLILLLDEEDQFPVWILHSRHKQNPLEIGFLKHLEQKFLDLAAFPQSWFDYARQYREHGGGIGSVSRTVLVLEDALRADAIAHSRRPAFGGIDFIEGEKHGTLAFILRLTPQGQPSRIQPSRIQIPLFALDDVANPTGLRRVTDPVEISMRCRYYARLLSEAGVA